MTAEQVIWASEQYWFEGSGEDEDGIFVIGRDSFGSRVALVFHEFENLTVWAAQQRNFEVAN